jgi:hypothetical protein
MERSVWIALLPGRGFPGALQMATGDMHRTTYHG